MDRLWWHISAAVRERESLDEVRREVHDEIGNGGKRFSERQRELTDWQQRDFVPTLTGIAGGCGGIAALRWFGVMAKSSRWMIVLPALPFYIVPYQFMFHAREAEYLVSMMREDKSSKFAKRLRSTFEASCKGRDSAVLEEIEAGSEIE